MIFAAMLSASLLATAPQETPDPWFAEDKARHFVTSFVAASLSASGTRALGLRRDPALLAGASFAAAAGLGKEIHDARAGGRFSVPDLVWDLLGIGAALVLLDAAR